jgi:hypothetical protein
MSVFGSCMFVDLLFVSFFACSLFFLLLALYVCFLLVFCCGYGLSVYSVLLAVKILACYG